jgi:hypothetical protein
MDTTARHAPPIDQQALVRLMASLHHPLQTLFQDGSHGPPGQRRTALQQRLFLRLELLWKLEEQVLLPALQDAEPRCAAEVALAAREIESMRDLVLTAQGASGSGRDLAFAALQARARRHRERSDALLAGAPSQAIDWPTLLKEVQGLLARWSDEVRQHGEVEDEDRDPVGLPPR